MKNLILISLDTVRADIAYSGKFTNIKRLRNSGVTFLNTISSSPFTPASHATIFTGLQPYNHGIRHLFKEGMKKNVKTLAEILKDKGYKTGAITSCPGMNKWYGFSKGFDEYDDEIPKLEDGSDPLKTVDVKKRGMAFKRADLVTKRAKAWIQKNGHLPFFLFAHFFDAHWPYNAPEQFAGNNPYEEEVAYADHYLGQLLDFLQEQNLLKNTTIVCVSDHGEDLEGLYPNDKGGKKLGHPEEFGHGCLLYDQTQKVILIINDNSFPKNINFNEQVRLVDVFPTVLDLLKIKFQKSVDGLSLVPLVIKGKPAYDTPAYSETFYPEEQALSSGKYKFAKNKVSIRSENKYKIIFNLNSSEIEIYDLEKDINEKINLYKNPKLVNRDE